MIRTSSRLPMRATQWGPLAVALLLGSALVASAAVNYRDDKVAAEAVATQQGVNIFMRLDVDWRASEDAVQVALVRSLRGNEASYLGLWDSTRLVFEAGESEFPGLSPTPLQLQMTPHRARMCFPDALLVMSESKDERHEGLRVGARVLVMEFEPNAATSLIRRSLIGLFLASGAAVLLMSAAFVLWRLAKRSEYMRTELERREHLAKLGAMSAVLAHEIRNPLASLKGHAQLVAENPLDPRTEARVERV